MQIKKGYKQLLAQANAEIETLSAADAIALLGQPDTVFVDLRDPGDGAGRADPWCVCVYPGNAGILD